MKIKSVCEKKLKISPLRQALPYSAYFFFCAFLQIFATKNPS